MLQTLEVRWFFDRQPGHLFDYPGSHPAPQQRTDWYAYPCHEHTGVKVRAGSMETKLLLEDHGLTDLGDGVVGRLGTWGKWSLPFGDGDAPRPATLEGAGWLPVEKVRYTWLYSPGGDPIDPADRFVKDACQVEWTAITVGAQLWWTVGLEAAGRGPSIEDSLRRAVHTVLASSPVAEGLGASRSYHYPLWLRQAAGRAGA